ncbi:MAG: pantoate--beta-alanine ligase [Acidimicrobiia bacterium]|nr:pantoate--beta-alanine ligase [Acidimicrobiia bacterium]
MKRVGTFADVHALCEGKVGLVPTMGYLHEGHLALMERARHECDTVVASVFVNPLQFGEGEDLAGYPRDIEKDAALAASVGVDVLFVPGTAEIYPDHPSVRLTVEALTMTMEGPQRPGHFEGVALVVAKLFAGLAPHVAYFGRKDAQQLAVVRRMTRDLSFPVEIVGVPIVREQDGLALSSRNIYLDVNERVAALSLSKGLEDASDLFAEGERDPGVLEAAVASRVGAERLATLHYAEVADVSEMVRPLRIDRDSFLGVAATVGTTRLIDNCHFLGGFAELGTRLDRRSTLYEGDR